MKVLFLPSCACKSLIWTLLIFIFSTARSIHILQLYSHFSHYSYNFLYVCSPAWKTFQWPVYTMQKYSLPECVHLDQLLSPVEYSICQLRETLNQQRNAEQSDWPDQNRESTSVVHSQMILWSCQNLYTVILQDKCAKKWENQLPNRKKFIHKILPVCIHPILPTGNYENMSESNDFDCDHCRW